MRSPHPHRAGWNGEWKQNISFILNMTILVYLNLILINKVILQLPTHLIHQYNSHQS
jgi:hypothetical protein